MYCIDSVRLECWREIELSYKFSRGCKFVLKNTNYKPLHPHLCSSPQVNVEIILLLVPEHGEGGEGGVWAPQWIAR